MRVADKYGMYQALDYLSTQLVLPRIVAGSTVEPFTVTHPVASLTLASMYGFTIRGYGGSQRERHGMG